MRRRTTTRRFSFALLALTIIAAGPLAASASASHFREGNKNWREAPGAAAGFQRVHVQYEQSWRWSAFGNPPVGTVISNPEGCIDWGDGQETCPQYVVEFVKADEDYMRVQAINGNDPNDPNIPHDYDLSQSTSYTISSSSCCTISTLQNANDATWNIINQVDLTNEDESAVSTVPAIVTLPESGSQPKMYTVPAGDAGGETIRFRLSNAFESCNGCSDPHPPGLTIDPNTGVVTWDTTGRSGLWWTGVVIESLVGGVVRATTHIQYIISVGGTTANESPVWDTPPTPADGTEFVVAPGQNLQFDLQATDPDAGDTVTITQNSGPGSLTASTPGNPATAAFSFTPTAADDGSDYIVQFIATDQDGAGPPFRSYTIKVRSAPPVGGGFMSGRSATYFGGTNNYNDNVGLRVFLSGVGDRAGNRKTFELPCVLGDPFDLQVEWGFRSNQRAHKWVGTSLTSALCVDAPGFTEGDPVAGFDIHRGTADGTFNGQPATASWQVVDKGETNNSGRRLDRLQITITDASGVLLHIGNRFIGAGNHQANPGSNNV